MSQIEFILTEKIEWDLSLTARISIENLSDVVDVLKLELTNRIVLLSDSRESFNHGDFIFNTYLLLQRRFGSEFRLNNAQVSSTINFLVQNTKISKLHRKMIAAKWLIFDQKFDDFDHSLKTWSFVISKLTELCFKTFSDDVLFSETKLLWLNQRIKDSISMVINKDYSWHSFLKRV